MAKENDKKSHNLVKKLSEIAEIRIGHPFRWKIVSNPNSDSYVIQLKDLDPVNDLKKESLTKVFLHGKKEPRYICKGDILFVGKGSRIFAKHISENLINTVASSHFLIITSKSNLVIPEYIAWFINSSFGQNYLQKNLKGSIVQHISKQSLLEMPVIIPTIEKQKFITNYHNATIKEEKLIKQLIEKKRIYNEAVLNNCLSNVIGG